MRRYSKYEVIANNMIKSDRNFRYQNAKYFHGCTMEAKRIMDRRVHQTDVRYELSLLRADFELYLQAREAYRRAVNLLRTQPKNIAPLPG